jgi:hypothetical protein
MTTSAMMFRVLLGVVCHTGIAHAFVVPGFVKDVRPAFQVPGVRPTLISPAFCRNICESLIQQHVSAAPMQQNIVYAEHHATFACHSHP